MGHQLGAMGPFVIGIADRIDAGDQLEGLGLVVLAALLGGAIGTERSISEKPAGLRTHMIVASTAASVTFIGELLTEAYGRGDPSRALHAVITGIGFLGAGTIITSRERGVVGLTTAAGLLFAAALGVMVGLGLVIMAVGSTVLALVIVHLLGPVDSKLQRLPLPLWAKGSSRDGATGDPGEEDEATTRDDADDTGDPTAHVSSDPLTPGGEGSADTTPVEELPGRRSDSGTAEDGR